MYLPDLLFVPVLYKDWHFEYFCSLFLLKRKLFIIKNFLCLYFVFLSNVTTNNGFKLSMKLQKMKNPYCVHKLSNFSENTSCPRRVSSTKNGSFFFLCLLTLMLFWTCFMKCERRGRIWSPFHSIFFLIECKGMLSGSFCLTNYFLIFGIKKV